MRHLAAALVLGMTACSTSDPRDAWPGTYAGTHECWGEWSNGWDYEEPPVEREVAIEQREDGSIYLVGDRDGQCDVELHALSPHRALVHEQRCDLQWEPGGPIVSLWYEDGWLDVEDGVLSYNLHWRVYPSQRTLAASCRFGER